MGLWHYHLIKIARLCIAWAVEGKRRSAQLNRLGCWLVYKETATSWADKDFVREVNIHYKQRSPLSCPYCVPKSQCLLPFTCQSSEQHTAPGTPYSRQEVKRPAAKVKIRRCNAPTYLNAVHNSMLLSDSMAAKERLSSWRLWGTCAYPSLAWRNLSRFLLRSPRCDSSL